MRTEHAAAVPAAPTIAPQGVVGYVLGLIRTKGLRYVLVSVVNGIFEELFVTGYIITSLTARRGMWTAINVSVVVRLLYHLYQGPIGIMTVVPMGLLYGYVYSRTRQLWPLMVAHVILDVIGLAMASQA